MKFYDEDPPFAIDEMTIMLMAALWIYLVVICIVGPSEIMRPWSIFIPTLLTLFLLSNKER